MVAKFRQRIVSLQRWTDRQLGSGNSAAVADAVVIDHFIAGDGTPDGTRTQATVLPAAMTAVDPHSVTLDYRDRMGALARTIMPGRVGANIDGFAGRFLP